MQQPSIFTKIINGEIPSHKVYENEHTLAFLDIYSVIPGHTLVVPKKQVEFVWDLKPADYEAVMQTAHKVALRLREVLGAPYVGQKIIGTDVPHAHVHLIPFNSPDEMKIAGHETAEPNHEKLAELAKTLYFA